MVQHVKILGILHIIFGAFGVLAAITVLLVFGGLAGAVGLSDQTNDSLAAVPVLGGIGLAIFCLLVVLSLPGLIGGIGLIQFKPWARILMLILSGLDLFGFPFHTALGIYGFWVLLNRETEMLFSGAPVPVVQRY